MSTNDHEHNPAPGPNTGLGRPLKVALGMMAVIGGFYLLMAEVLQLSVPRL